jgi:hypothetical protein
MASLKVQPMQLDWEVLAQNERIWLRHWDEHIRGQSAG